MRKDYAGLNSALVFGGVLAVCLTASAWGEPIAEALTPKWDFVTADHAPEIVHTAYAANVSDKPVAEGEDPNEDALITAALEVQGYFRPEVPLDYALQDILHTACDRYGVDYAVALGLIEAESRFDAEAVNPVTGCYGLSQLNPKYFPSGLTPAENIEAGIAYLGSLLERYSGDLPAALTAYNAGHDAGSRTYANAVLSAAERWGYHV